jgi:selenocysteine lyase/cysteine desulfurase
MSKVKRRISLSFTKELIQEIRSEFPRIQSDWRGRKRIFFDNAAGTMMLDRVARAETIARIDRAANECGLDHPSTVYDESRDFDDLVIEGKRALQDLLNAPSYENLTIGGSTTDLIFKVAYAIGHELIGKENIVTTYNEHYANTGPWLELKERKLVKEVRFVKIHKEDATVDLDDLQTLVDKNTAVVSVTGASNLTGTKSPLKEIAKAAKKVGAYYVVDGTQLVPHAPVDVQEIGCDFFIFSGYKFFTSAGGFIYGKGNLFKKLKFYGLFGYGTPYGTLDQAKFASIKAVVDYLVWLSHKVEGKSRNTYSKYTGRKRACKIALDAIEKHEAELSRTMLEGSGKTPGLAKMRHIKLFGIRDAKRVFERDPAFAFTVDGMKEIDVARYLWDKHNVALRFGDLWNMSTKFYKVPTMVRASLVHYNTRQEVLEFLKGVNELAK